MERVIHQFPPICDNNSKILILGSIPSIKSREIGFYYGHPQNRFWKVLSRVLEEDIPTTIEQKKKLLHHHQIALWDVLASCEIKGSQDATIQNPVVNDIELILQNTKVNRIYTNGSKAYQLYQKYCYPITKIEAILLPSTSPANAVQSLEQLVEAYSILKK